MRTGICAVAVTLLLTGGTPDVTVRHATADDAAVVVTDDKYVPGATVAGEINVVIAAQPSDLERFAAAELQRYAQRLFGAAVPVTASPGIEPMREP